MSSLPLIHNKTFNTEFNSKFYYKMVDELLNEFENIFLYFKNVYKKFRILSNPFQNIEEPPRDIEYELIYLNNSEFERGFYNNSNSEDKLVDYYKNLSYSDYPCMKLFLRNI